MNDLWRELFEALELDGTCSILYLDKLDLAGLPFLAFLLFQLTLHRVVCSGLGGGASGCYY